MLVSILDWRMVRRSAVSAIKLNFISEDTYFSMRCWMALRATDSQGKSDDTDVDVDVDDEVGS